MNRLQIRKLVLSALCLALCLVLPFLTGQIPQVGQMLLPMHLPAFLCGFACGWPYALLVGLIAPILRSLLFNMPPLFPTGVAMAFELATYGVVSALAYERFPIRGRGRVYAALLSAMVGGRVVWGAVRLALSGLSASSFTFGMFVSGALLNGLPGVACQLVLVPLLVRCLERAVPLQKNPEK